MAELQNITLNDVRAAFDAGKAKKQTYRGQGRTDVVQTYATVEDFISTNKVLKSHLVAEKKAIAKAEAEAKAKEEAKAKKIAELEAE